jgi:hypothetical protein
MILRVGNFKIFLRIVFVNKDNSQKDFGLEEVIQESKKEKLIEEIDKETLQALWRNPRGVDRIEIEKKIKNVNRDDEVLEISTNIFYKKENKKIINLKDIKKRRNN